MGLGFFISGFLWLIYGLDFTAKWAIVGADLRVCPIRHDMHNIRHYIAGQSIIAKQGKHAGLPLQRTPPLHNTHPHAANVQPCWWALPPPPVFALAKPLGEVRVWLVRTTIGAILCNHRLPSAPQPLSPSDNELKTGSPCCSCACRRSRRCSSCSGYRRCRCHSRPRWHSTSSRCYRNRRR